MAGPEKFGEIAVIAAALVLIADQQRQRRTGGAPLENAGKNLHRIAFIALRHQFRLARTATVELNLNIGRFQLHPRRHTVDDCAQCDAMGFAEGGDPEQSSENASAHRIPRSFNPAMMASCTVSAGPSPAIGKHQSAISR
ncbi:hypothetical protein SDC9_72819 [bioreactor metagenome]|uniref:Uncharacterized protein n=1 Tax=bioreactor metagenome TaxID=1076179 RepID=A0A644YED0_9ZZZZ